MSTSQMDISDEVVQSEGSDSAPNSSEIVHDLVALDKEGDVILQVDDTESLKVVEFLVSKKVLCLASPVFGAMFGPHFVEGQNPHPGNLVRVKLEEDNPHAMKTILEVLHHTHKIGLEPMNAKSLAYLALLCDKYDCKAALRPWTYYWFHDLERVPPAAEELSFLLLAAYNFDERKHFTNISVLAVKQMTLDFPASWYSHKMLSLIPETVSGKRVSQRKELSRKANSPADAVNNQIQRLLRMLHIHFQRVAVTLAQSKAGYEMQLQNCNECGRTPPIQAKKCHPCNNSSLSQKYCTASFRIAEFFAMMERVELWPSVEPFESCSVADLVVRISCASSDNKHLCNAGTSCPLILELQRLRIQANQIQEKIEGLCLVCIRSGMDGHACKCVP